MLCSNYVLPRGISYERRLLSKDLGSEDPLCVTADPCCWLLCALVCWFLAAHEDVVFSVYDWLYQCARPGIALCPARNSVQATSRVSTPRIDAVLGKPSWLQTAKKNDVWVKEDSWRGIYDIFLVGGGARFSFGLSPASSPPILCTSISIMRKTAQP